MGELPYTISMDIHMDLKGREIEKKIELYDENSSLTDLEKAIFLNGGYPKDIRLHILIQCIDYHKWRDEIDSENCSKDRLVRKIVYRTETH